MKAGTGFSSAKDGFVAAGEAVLQAMECIGEASIVFAFFTGDYDAESVYRAVKRYAPDTKIIGGSTPGIITSDGVLERGVAACAFDKRWIQADTYVIGPDEIKSINDKKSEFIMKGSIGLTIQESDTMFIFVDSLCDNIPLFLRRLYDSMGSKITYIGGGTGSGLNMQGGFQLAESGVYKESIAIAHLKGARFGVGIGHGWVSWGEPMVVTKTSGKILYEIDGFPAASAYMENTGMKDLEEFTYYSMKYPLGIPASGTNFLIRDPVNANEDKSIRLVTEIPQNCVISLMKEDEKGFAAAAESVAKNVLLSEPDKKPGVFFLFDCVSRYILMKNGFKKELRAVLNLVDKSCPAVGILTFGEIGSFSSVPMFHNKTIVIAAGW